MPGGRPKKKLDYDLIARLSSIQCTQEEIALTLGVCRETLERDAEFCRIYKTKINEGKASLRRMQWQAANDGDKTMLVWLGKQYLSQSDKRGVKITGKDGGAVEIESPRERIERRMSGIAAKIGTGENIEGDNPTGT